jgi:hypothetical protein
MIVRIVGSLPLVVLLVASSASADPPAPHPAAHTVAAPGVKIEKGAATLARPVAPTAKPAPLGKAVPLAAAAAAKPAAAKPALGLNLEKLRAEHADLRARILADEIHGDLGSRMFWLRKCDELATALGEPLLSPEARAATVRGGYEVELHRGLAEAQRGRQNGQHAHIEIGLARAARTMETLGFDKAEIEKTLGDYGFGARDLARYTDYKLE